MRFNESTLSILVEADPVIGGEAWPALGGIAYGERSIRKILKAQSGIAHCRVSSTHLHMEDIRLNREGWWTDGMSTDGRRRK